MSVFLERVDKMEKTQLSVQKLGQRFGSTERIFLAWDLTHLKTWTAFENWYLYLIK